MFYANHLLLYSTLQLIVILLLDTCLGPQHVLDHGLLNSTVARLGGFHDLTKQFVAL